MSSQRWTVYLFDQADKMLGVIGFRGDNVQYTSNAVSIVLLADCTLGEWYKISIQWKSSPAALVRYRVNDGDWTAWVLPANPVAAPKTSWFEIENYNLSDVRVGYIDHINYRVFVP